MIFRRLLGLSTTFLRIACNKRLARRALLTCVMVASGFAPGYAEPTMASNCPRPQFDIAVSRYGEQQIQWVREDQPFEFQREDRIQIHLIGEYPGDYSLVRLSPKGEVKPELLRRHSANKPFFFPCGEQPDCQGNSYVIDPSTGHSGVDRFSVAYWPCMPENERARDQIKEIFNTELLSGLPECKTDNPPPKIDPVDLITAHESRRGDRCEPITDQNGRIGLQKIFDFRVAD